MTLLIIATLLMISWELIHFRVHGGFVSKQVSEEFMNLDESRLTLNPYDNGILLTTPFIASHGFAFLSKYYIGGIGRVPRWSKLHKRIEEYYAIAIKNQNK